MRFNLFLVALLIVAPFAFAQTPQGVYIHQLSNGETVEVYSNQAQRDNGIVPAKVVHHVLDSKGDDSGVIDMAIGPKTITGASNATPIVITAVAHGYSDGDYVFISGITVNTNANGHFKIKNKADDTFELTDYGDTDIAGNGVYGAGGTAFLSFVYVPAITEIAVLKRLVGYAHDATYDSAKYMGVDALTNGIDIEVRDATSQIWQVSGEVNVKIWLDWALHAGVDVTNGDGGVGTKTEGTVRWTFGNSFGNVRVDGTAGQVFVMTIRDDLTGLLGQTFNVQGFLK